jgi:cytochrome P450
MTTVTDIPIEDPQFYLDDPWPTFAWMQREAPFWYYEPLDTFVVTRYEDIKAIAALPDVFVSSKGLFLNDLKFREQAGDEVMTDRFFPKGGEQVGTTDPPRHRELRRILAPAFTEEALERLGRPIQEYVDELLAGISPGEVVDWITYASLVPIVASTHLIGLPGADAERVRFWSDQLEKLGGDITFEEVDAAAAELQSLQAYIVEAIEEKRGNPEGEDLLSVLLQQELDNQKVSQANVVMFAMTMMAAGSDTTRSLLAGMVDALARRPDQWQLLRKDRSLVRFAVEETMRWVTPARAFVRTATADVKVSGHQIREGQHVYLMYMAGNRDESVFTRPHEYDVTRREAVRHLSFGAGIHVCAASRLIRREAPIVLNALLDRFSRIELAEQPTPVVHIIRNGWSRMPAIFHRA